MTKKTKYLIIGQGIVGTWMSYFLSKQGIDCIVINDESIPSASWVASGVINPVTGRRIVQTWMIEDVLPFAIEHYTQFEQYIDATFFKNKPIILLHPSAQMKESFQYRLDHENIYLAKEEDQSWNQYFKLEFGTGKINEVYWIDLQEMIQQWRSHLQLKEQYINAYFNTNELSITEKSVLWKDVEAEYIVYCDGIQSQQNKLFRPLPFAPNKGEAIIANISSLPQDYIYKSSFSIVPWKKEHFWIGSNYEWSFKDNMPSASFKEKVNHFLQNNLKVPFTITDHITGIRPANTERRPFVGTHPQHPRIAICNGMGTKGCSLAPYFTKQLIDYLELGKPIHPEASIERFQIK